MSQSIPSIRASRRPRRGPSEGALAFWLLPAALIFGGVLLYPTLYTSLFAQSLTGPQRGTPFMGLKTCAHLFADARFLDAPRDTLVYGVAEVVGSFIIGVPMALVAYAESRLR